MNTPESEPPSIPYRPLPKIVAPVIAPPPPTEPGERPARVHTPEDPLKVGDTVNIYIVPKTNDPPFWRTYEVTIIDGRDCRLVTPNKRFSMNAKTRWITYLRNLQRTNPRAK